MSETVKTYSDLKSILEDDSRRSVSIELGADLNAKRRRWINCNIPAVTIDGRGHIIYLADLRPANKAINALWFKKAERVKIEGVTFRDAPANTAAVLKARGNRSNASLLSVVNQCQFINCPESTGILCGLFGKIEVEDCHFDGVATGAGRFKGAPHCIYHTGHDLTVRRSKFVGSGNVALLSRNYYTQEPDEYLPVGTVIIEDCSFQGCEGGISISCGGAEKIRIVRNKWVDYGEWVQHLSPLPKPSTAIIRANRYPPEITNGRPFKIGNDRITFEKWQSYGFDAGVVPVKVARGG